MRAGIEAYLEKALADDLTERLEAADALADSLEPTVGPKRVESLAQVPTTSTLVKRGWMPLAGPFWSFQSHCRVACCAG